MVLPPLTRSAVSVAAVSVTLPALLMTCTVTSEPPISPPVASTGKELAISAAVGANDSVLIDAAEPTRQRDEARDRDVEL